MTTTPPDRYLDWATNSEALNTDPGASETADGWAVADSPAPAHFNYVMHSAAGWGSFVSKVLASRIAFGNIERTGASPFLALNSVWIIRYDDTVNRWYAITRDSSASAYEVELYDSDDGVTWNSLVADLDTDVASILEVTRPVVGNGQLVVGAQDVVYVSTDATIANLNTTGVTVGLLDTIRELSYDVVNGRFICVGGDGGDGKIYQAVDPAGTWTLAAVDAADEYLTLATDPTTGISVAGTDIGNSMDVSTNGTSWSSASVSPANALDRVVFCPSLKLFVGIDTSDNLYFTTDGDTWIDTSLNINFVYTTAEFTWFVEKTTNMVYTAFPKATYIGYETLGPMSGDDLNMMAGMGVCEVHGGQGKLIFPYDGNDYLAIARYGAQT